MDKISHQREEEHQKEVERRDAVQQLSLLPANCPVGNCSAIVFPSNLMKHMLHRHAIAGDNLNAEIYEHRPLTMFFNPTGYEHGQNDCVATLLYGGQMNKPNTLPGTSCMSLPHTDLFHDYHKYANYLPIMMMVCHCTWFAQLSDKRLESEMVAENASTSGIYVLWLTSPATTSKLYYTLTIYDRSYSYSHSVIRMVRDYTSQQNPTMVTELMDIGKSNSITIGKQREPVIPMELIIYETPVKSKVHRNSQKKLQAMLPLAQDLYAKQSMPRAKLVVKRGIYAKMSATRRPSSDSTGASAMISN
ncbi:GH17077 [Drosophila grimshawi]|uniref:GH17077 n=1 Tax=Drosophila grimshawi TaxID=7222 RepID=B4J024_DROGR|nr:GH17077 [Drosophila grimshawi]